MFRRHANNKQQRSSEHKRSGMRPKSPNSPNSPFFDPSQFGHACVSVPYWHVFAELMSPWHAAALKHACACDNVVALGHVTPASPFTICRRVEHVESVKHDEHDGVVAVFPVLGHVTVVPPTQLHFVPNCDAVMPTIALLYCVVVVAVVALVHEMYRVPFTAHTSVEFDAYPLLHSVDAFVPTATPVVMLHPPVHVTLQ